MIDKVIKYANKEGFTVTRGGKGPSTISWIEERPYNVPDRIQLKKHNNPTHELLDLLHELGHHQIRKNYHAYCAKNPAVALAEHMEYTQGIMLYKRRKEYGVETVREEYEAWDRGMQIARKLRINIDSDTYRKYYTKSISSYMQYYGKK